MAAHEQVHRPKHSLEEREAGEIVGRNGGRDSQPDRDRQTHREAGRQRQR